jgi:endonuclease III
VSEPDSRPDLPPDLIFDIDAVLERVAATDRSLPKPVLFALADDGFASPFEQVIACVISVRTLEEVTDPTARALFAVARTPARMLSLTVEEVDRIIDRSTFHFAKASQIRRIAERAQSSFGGEIPCEESALLALPGVGPKCANLVLAIACGVPRVAVDVHVQRVTNRWGYVATRTPEQTLAALELMLPRRHWIAINRLLVPFGKYICTGRLPKCSTCPVRAYCPRIGVTASR